MTRKKKAQEEQPIVTEVATVKKTATKKAKLQPKVEIEETPQKESEPAIIEEHETLLLDDGSKLAGDYDLEDMLNSLIKSAERDDEEPISDEILDKFDRDLEAKGLGDAYFQKKEEQLKEMELSHELHEFAIDEMLNEED